MNFMIETDVILLAEDDEDHSLLVRRAFARAKLVNPLHTVKNGEEAIAYLSGEGQYANRAEYPLPALLLLDLKMPKKNGFEVLTWIRQQPGLQGLRIVVLTSSDEVRDVNQAYQLGANSFLVKPLAFNEFVAVAEVIQGYWLFMSKAPELCRAPLPKEANH